MQSIHGEPSFQLSTPEVDLCLTARGGHLAPVVIHLPGRDVAPYSLSPWLPEDFPACPVLLSVLRGDFLCLPFGGQTDGPPHGDPANAEWTLVETGERSLTAALQTTDSGAFVEKILTVRPGHHAVYAEHRIANLEGDFSYGTHPVLDLSSLPAGAGRITTSPFRWASVFPGAFSDPAAGDKQCLMPGAAFSDLREVPLANGGATDLTRYPARPGNDDLVMMANEPATPAQPFAWSAAVGDGWVWFALKNPADFPATLLWFSNGGRSAEPWLGRHLGRIGIEEVCSYFSHGVDLSRTGPLEDLGIPTVRRFLPDETVSLRVVHAVAAVPQGFGAVASIKPDGPDAVTLTGDSGLTLTTPLDWGHVI